MQVRLRPRIVVAAVVAATTALTTAAGVAGTTSGSSGTTQTYVVLYRSLAVPADAGTAITRAGGSVVASYGAIGVVVARSANSNFGSAVMRDNRVDGVSATTDFATQVSDVESSSDGDADGPPPGELPNAPASDSDTLSPLQWDMRQIHAPEAHAVTGGSPAVVVGDIDTGLDFNHPDLAPNYDAANSTDCTSGAPAPLAPGNDKNGHGTHTAGTIAAAANGAGIVGVAPNVRIAGIKASNDDGFFFPEMVVCAFMWAGSHHLDVTNNSYFADPYLFNCRNDATQRAIWKAEQRAIRYALNQGVTVVAAEGNESEDLSHPGVDTTSPDYPDGSAQTRDVTNACVVVPVEVPGVIGVTATGSTTQGTSAGAYADHLKSFYSSYGVSSADLTAPGGDSIFATDPSTRRVLSTYPADRPCSRSVQEPSSDPNYPTATYCYLQGTSMASPHVAGVAALVISWFGSASTPQNGKLRPDQVAALLEQTADPQSCPQTLPAGYQDVSPPADGSEQTCQGDGNGHTSWYGSGEVDAFNAVTHTNH